MASFDHLRRAALALPEVDEGDHFGGAAFLVRGKTFALWSVREARTIMRLTPAHQTLLFEVRPEVFQPCRVGTGVWAYVDLASLDEAEVEALIREAWGAISPKNVRLRHEARSHANGSGAG